MKILDSQKHLFSLEEGIHYFNCASKAPLLKSAEVAAIKALQHNRNPYDFSPAHFFKTTDKVRGLFAKLIHAQRASQIAVIPSVSYGMASAMKNIPYQKGQHALVVDQEFPSDYFAVKRWCDTHGAPLKTVRPDPNLTQKGKDWNERILEQIQADTAVLLLSNVHWMNGLKFDLKRIGERCQETGTRFIVDGTQSVAALAINVNECHIDALICASYKWLMGAYGLGLAYYGESFNEGTPIEEAWMNRTNTQDFSKLSDYESQYKADAQRYNVGETSKFIQMPMLEASLKQLLEWPPESIQEYTGRLLQPLLDFLDSKRIIYEEENYRANHLFGMTLPHTDNEKLKASLTENKVYLSTRGESLRLALNVFNEAADIEKLIEVLDQHIS